MTFEQLIQHYPLNKTIVGDYYAEEALSYHGTYTYEDIHDLFTNPPINCIFCVEKENDNWIVHFFWYLPVVGYMIQENCCGLVTFDSETEEYEFINPDKLNHDLMLPSSEEWRVFDHLDPENVFWTWDEFNTYYKNNKTDAN